MVSSGWAIFSTPAMIHTAAMPKRAIKLTTSNVLFTPISLAFTLPFSDTMPCAFPETSPTMMGPMPHFLIAGSGAALGAGARYLLTIALGGGLIPLLILNIVGSALMGYTRPGPFW